jgi:hypothetical protein
MLIIAVGHGHIADAFSCSCDAKRGEADPEYMDSVLACIMQKQMLTKNSIDELIVVENDEVVAHYTWEDGLGPELPDEG